LISSFQPIGALLTHPAIILNNKDRKNVPVTLPYNFSGKNLFMAYPYA